MAAEKPFFLSVNPIAPHAQTELQAGPAQHNPPVPAEKHKHLFADVRVPRTLNFNPDVVSHQLPDSAAWAHLT